MIRIAEFYQADKENIEKCINLVAKRLEVSKEYVLNVVSESIPSVDPLSLLDLPPELIVSILKTMDAKEVLTLCSTSKRLQEICGDRIWKDLMKRDFDYTGKMKSIGGEKPRNWKEFYWLLKFRGPIKLEDIIQTKAPEWRKSVQEMYQKDRLTYKDQPMKTVVNNLITLGSHDYVLVPLDPSKAKVYYDTSNDEFLLTDGRVEFIYEVQSQGRKLRIQGVSYMPIHLTDVNDPRYVEIN